MSDSWTEKDIDDQLHLAKQAIQKALGHLSRIESLFNLTKEFSQRGEGK